MSSNEYMSDEEERGIGEALVLKAKRHPFLAVGIVGFLTTLGIGAYRFKNRSKSSPMSLYFIQLRVAAQCAVIGTLTVGMTYNMVTHFILKDKTDKPKSLEH